MKETFESAFPVLQPELHLMDLFCLFFSFLISHTSLTGREQLLCLLDVQVKHTINRQTQMAQFPKESPLRIPLIFPTQDIGTGTN